uniref:NADH-ubiquinone oxidoreductase chain 2 n=1 Tax=Cucujoidea sp. 40 KM-2017 TaxID=2219379 RepID=A0A346RHX4_9CUCU|nr:NADH dehydrogenase subunit 2 [Cucujoidea sp. 40 KM-2017]
MKFWKLLFFNIMIFGTLTAVSSVSWFSMWMGLEINLLAIIPLIANSKNIYSAEAAMKYFVIQTLASVILLYSLILSMSSTEFLTMNMKNISLISLNTALLSKMGAAPFHFWFPEIIEGLSWINSFIMLTWQKIAPMSIFMYNPKMLFLTTFVIITSMMIGATMSLNQTSIRKILVYSSINHIGWMLSCIIFNQSIWLTYFMVYSFISLNLILTFASTNIFYMKQMFSSLNSKKTLKILVYSSFLSMGGLPPFLGFFPKWITINMMIEKNFFIAVLMIFITLVMLFTYSRLMFNSMLVKNVEFKTQSLSTKKTVFLSFINFSAILITPLMYILF